MKIVKSENCKIAPSVPGIEMRVMFGGAGECGEVKQMGVAVFKPGTRVPAEGLTAHDDDEYAYIISGSIDCQSGGEQYCAEAGSATFIPAGEGHCSYNSGEEDCVLVYMLTKAGTAKQ